MTKSEHSVSNAWHSNLNVSAEPHLLEKLKSVASLLPAPISIQLSQALESPSTTIDYSLLDAVSRWSRSTAGQTALKTHTLHAPDYSMISLLAGAQTSPQGRFGEYVPPAEPEDLALAQKRERKAIATIVNGLFSIIGTTAAAWYGSLRTGWRDEWVRDPSNR